MDISFNGFSGGLHAISFSSWKKMVLLKGNGPTEPRGFGISPDYFTQVTLTTNGLQLKHAKVLQDFKYLDLSSNNFQGEIPEAIGDLSSLRLLNLSSNALTGRIPRSFGNMAELEALDLSANKLAETIPVELERLTFLSVLNLSYNKLAGRIPHGNQFATFESDSYNGNAGLCGVPLNTSCTSFDGSPHQLRSMQPHGSSEMMEWNYVFLFWLGAIYLQLH